MTRPESEFPTIADLRDRLSELVEQGLGALAVQVLVVPDSTMQAIAQQIGGHDTSNKPALMIELTATPAADRLPVVLISADRWSGHEMKTTTAQ